MAGPVWFDHPTMTIYLVRHGSAGRRGSFDDDTLRPLDPTGRAQAEAIAAGLAEVGIGRLLASPALRCIQTLEPLGARLGLEVEPTMALMEGQDPRSAVDLTRTLAVADTDAALCSHGDVIPEIIQRLAREGMSIVGRPGWEKGSTWRLTTRGGDVVAAEHLGRRDPPD